MFEIKLKPKHRLPDEYQLQKLEKYLGYPLPKDYRSFLLTTNGGRPVTYCGVRVDDINENVLFGDFWSIGTYADIQFLMEISRSDLPEGFMIFAADPGGNKFLMDLSEGELTPVYYWEKHHFRRRKTKTNTFCIADSFTDFLNMLYPWPQDDETQQTAIEQ